MRREPEFDVVSLQAQAALAAEANRRMQEAAPGPVALAPGVSQITVTVSGSIQLR